MPRRPAFVLAVAALALAPGAAEASITVDTTTDELSSTNNHQCSLREAITIVNGDDLTNRGCTQVGGGSDRILLKANSTYPIAGASTFDDGNLNGDFDVFHDMTIEGAGASSTIIDGAHKDRVFDVFRKDTVAPHDQNPVVGIEGVTIRNGQAPTIAGHSPSGGGIFISAPAEVDLDNDVITQNAAGMGVPNADGGAGGGILNTGVLTLDATTVDHNVAGDAGSSSKNGGSGGGIYTSAELTVTNSTIAANLSGDGGSDSFAFAGKGGGVYAENGPVAISGSTILGNQAGAGDIGGSGGGIYSGSSDLDLVNTTITGNSAGSGSSFGGFGGGVGIEGPATIQNDTIAGNGVPANGGGGGIDASAATVVANTILASNATNQLGGNCSSTAPQDGGHNLSFGDASCPPGFGTGDPMLGPLQDNGGPTQTMAISGGGAAADQILASACPSTDQRAILRPQGPLCDIGAFEVRSYDLSVSLAGAGSGTVTSSIGAINCGASCSGRIDEGTAVTLNAVPNADSSFAGWSGGCSGTDPCTTTLNAATTITASFAQRPALAVVKAGTGTGSVVSSPAGIDCGPACNARFDSGSSVTLTPSPSPGSAFAGWSGGGCSETSACTLTLGSDTSVTATFTATPVPAPNTKIAKAKVDPDAGTATFTFSSSAGSMARADSGFQCALKAKHKKLRFKTCKSPKRYKHLKDGKYTFEVRAFNPAGTDPSPAKKRFRIA
jgi:CSLREA domain-containing protein